MCTATLCMRGTELGCEEVPERLDSPGSDLVVLRGGHGPCMPCYAMICPARPGSYQQTKTRAHFYVWDMSLDPRGPPPAPGATRMVVGVCYVARNYERAVRWPSSQCH